MSAAPLPPPPAEVLTKQLAFKLQVPQKCVVQALSMLPRKDVEDLGVLAAYLVASCRQLKIPLYVKRVEKLLGERQRKKFYRTLASLKIYPDVATYARAVAHLTNGRIKELLQTAEEIKRRGFSTPVAVAAAAVVLGADVNEVVKALGVSKFAVKRAVRNV